VGDGDPREEDRRNAADKGTSRAKDAMWATVIRAKNATEPKDRLA